MRNKKRKTKHRRLALPPYARELADARARNMVPRRQDLGHVVVALEWRREIARDYPVVVLPEKTDPFSFDWRFVAGLDVFVPHSAKDRHRAYRLMEALFAARAAHVELFDMDSLSILRFTPVSAHA